MQLVVTRFATLQKEARDPERAIIDIADYEIDGNATGLEQARYLPFVLTNEIFERPSHAREELDCTSEVEIAGYFGVREILGRITWWNLFRLIADERQQRLISSRFSLSAISLMSTRNLNEKNLRLQSINQSYEARIEFYVMMDPSFVKKLF